MKIVFWGTPKYAADNLRHLIITGQEVIAVVTQPDKKRSRGNKLCPSPVKQTAIDFGIPVYETYSISRDQNTSNILISLNADIYIVVAFGQILPREILEQPKLGCWNSHASLLPLWRGAAPIQWSILNNDRKTGICIMAMEEGLDTGAVIEQESTDITDSDNLEILTNRLSKISSRLLVKSLKNIKQTEGLNKIERLNQLNAIKQSELNCNPTYARQIKKQDYLINWNQNANIINKMILGLYPNAYTLHNAKRVKILQSTLILNSENNILNNSIAEQSLNHLSPGEVIIINQKYGIVIMTKDYPIIIKIAQLEGKKRTDGYTLSVQSKLKIKDILGN